MNLNALQGRFTDFDEFASELNDDGYDASYTFIEPNYGNLIPVLTPGDYTCGNSQHPLDDLTRGERLIKTVYETIRNSPLWEKSVLLITYDEHGGFFDHVAPPPAVAPGDSVIDPANNHNNFDFKQLGVRVPAIVISPFVPRNTVDGTRYDHTALLATVERLFGTQSITNRDGAANDFLHLLSLATPRTDAPTTLPEPALSDFKCEDDREETDLGTSSSGLQGGGGGDRGASDRGPGDGGVSLPASFWGFAQVAVRRHLAVTPIRDRKTRRAIKHRYMAVRSTAEAISFVQDARRAVRADKQRQRLVSLERRRRSTR
jgi:hypothetical protein